MGEQHRVATVRAIVVQETATALVATMDERRERLFVEDGAVALGLCLATYAAVNADGPEHAQELLVRVMASAQTAVRAVMETRAQAKPPEPKPVRELKSSYDLDDLEIWEREGWKPIRNEGTLAAARAVALVHRFNDMGGHLHIVSEDDNVSDAHLDMCVRGIEGPVTEWMLERLGSMDLYRQMQEAERVCLAAMRLLSEVERVSATRLSWELDRKAQS